MRKNGGITFWTRDLCLALFRFWILILICLRESSGAEQGEKCGDECTLNRGSEFN